MPLDKGATMHSVANLRLTESLLFIKANKEWVDKVFCAFCKTWGNMK